jgi:hypothetical protein
LSFAFVRQIHNFAVRSRKAFAMTDTEIKLITPTLADFSRANVTVISFLSFVARLAGRNDKQNHDQNAYYRPKPHPSAHPATHPAAHKSACLGHHRAPFM